jgi:Cro/C1-type HTH DNA-binding domain
MDTITLQQELFKTIRGKIPAHLSAADELARILDISTDSAYRRIRGEKTISLDELSALCFHYHISMDELMNIQTGAFLFQGNIIDSNAFRFDKYMEAMLRNFAYMASFKQKEFYYLCKDIPVFQHYHFKEIAAFKYYFWMKTILHTPDFARRKFSFAEYPDELFEIGKKVLSLYSSLNVVEIINIETVNSTIRQIEFHRDGQMFESDEDIWKIYAALEKLIDHMEDQADAGYMFNYGDPDKKPLGGYQFYFNEVVLGDNTMMAVLDGMKMVYLVHSGVNYMATRDLSFCNYTSDTIHNLMQKSTLISSAEEHERARFFKFLRNRITKQQESLNV